MGAARGRHGKATRIVAALLCLFAAACSPTLDWRETMAEGSGIVASFPCRPDRHARSVTVASATVRMEMLVCGAGGATYALGFYDAADAAAVDAGLAELRTSMLSNIGAVAARERPFALAGATAVRLGAEGRRPDGGTLRLEAAFFARDRRVFQAAIVGTALRNDAVDPFFEGLKLPR